MSDRLDMSKYSILVMGKTQAGKSTLVEHIKNYANPSYAIDRSLLGNGNLSKTESTRPFYIESNLPAYEAFRKDTGEVLLLDNLATKCEDEDDYRELLFSREKDVGLRLAPHHPNEPSDLVEFRFLDTPGLNDTNDRDSSHAVNIISEMINTRSFNLIVIIVSYKNPLTQEQQLALEYYANVFRGLHTRIMFLHTHVDYADIHHTNHSTHINLIMKNKALSKMFRRHDIEGTFDEENVKEYPSMTIDLVSKKRPVINCLIRNTIREILKMATQPAVDFDTSIQNINRIRAITHPSQFNDEERERIKQRFLAEAAKFVKPAEAAKFEKPAEEEEVDVGGTDLEQINILLIGDVQSGKTSLVETFRLYADTAYQAKTEHITQGNSRFADEKVKITAFLADLHTVQIRRVKADTDGYNLIDLEEEARTLSEEDFEDLFDLGPMEVDTVINSSNGGKKYRFNIYEGPGLDASTGDLDKTVLSINRALVDSNQKFHQVLFALSPGPITSAIRTTVRICSDIFSNFVPFFSFVHTKIDYPKLHADNKEFRDSMEERQELLRRHIESSATLYLIDCNLQSNWPVQRAKTMNVVHDILTAATKQTPVFLGRQISKRSAHVTSRHSLVSAMNTVFSEEKSIDTSDIAILVLGGPLSGKSSFVEHAKAFAETVYKDLSEDPYTAQAPSTVFESCLHAYEVVRQKDKTQLNVIHLNEMFSEDIIGSMEHLQLLRSGEYDFISNKTPHSDLRPSLKSAKYMIVDTPAINNPIQDDERNIIRIVSSRPFNLILVAVSNLHSLTIELQLSLEYLSKILQGLHCNIAFLHTHVDYSDYHPHNEDFYHNLKLRNLLLGRIFRNQGLPSQEEDPRSHMFPQDDEMEERPSFILDLRPDQGPIVQGLNRNTIREILLLAVMNSPLEIDTSEENEARILAIPHPRHLTEEEHKAIKARILAEDEAQKTVFITDDCLGQRYKVRDSLFHYARAINSKLVDI